MSIRLILLLFSTELAVNVLKILALFTMRKFHRPLADLSPFFRPGSKENRPVKVWDQEMKECKMYQLSSAPEQPVPRSVCRGGPKVWLI